VMDWNTANEAAQSRSFLGVQGHLVTIRNADENLFLTHAFGPYPIGPVPVGWQGAVRPNMLQAHWTGGMVAFPVVDPLPTGRGVPPGGWWGSWVTGDPFDYNNFAPGEPSMANGFEQRIMFGSGTSADGVTWNAVGAGPIALGASSPLPTIQLGQGFVVEFDVADAPEPATAILLGMGGLAAAGWCWFRRASRRNIAG